MTMRPDRREASRAIEELYDWKGWMWKIPALSFRPDWLVRIVPPFHGAIVRFRVSKKETPDKDVSVYLDCYDELGCVGQPYWEIYPAKHGDIDRFLMNETEELIQAIAEALE